LKTTSDDLFRLIKALNKSEKGYFKKFAAKNATGSKQNYIYLFEAIDSMESYDENLLKKKLKDASLLRQLAVYKVYLFNLILKALNLYGAYENSESQLNEMLSNIRILTSKHLYREARKIIRKAKELAYKFDKHKFIMELLASERHILMLAPQKNITEKRSQIFREQMDLIERIREFYDYNYLCDRMTILVDNEADFSSGENSARLEEIISDKLITSPSGFRGYYAQMNYYHTLLIYSGTRGNNEDILKHLKNQIAHDEANRQFIGENPQNYVYALINLLLYSNYAKDHAEAERTMAKLESVKKRLKGKIPRENEIQILFHASNIEMLIYEKNCDMQAGRNKIKQIEEDLKTFGNDVPFHIKSLMYVNIACFSIIDENYTAALKYLNKILNTPELSARADVNIISKVLELVVHYEMNNFDLIEYLLNSAKKILKNQGGVSKTAQLLLKFFSSIIKLSRDEHSKSFDELVFSLKRAGDGGVLMSYFDFISWAQSRVSGIKMVDVLKNKQTGNS
jgi:hypothetical protein